MVYNPQIGKVLLKWDLAIDKAASEGDNDAALEYSTWQRQYMEMYCTDPAQQAEWARRKWDGLEGEE